MTDRPKQPFQADLVVVRADTAAGWRHLRKHFGAGYGRPIVKPDKPWLAIYGRISKDRWGWPVYVPEGDDVAVIRYTAERMTEARLEADKLNHYWSLGRHSTVEAEEWYAQWAAAAELATTSDEKADAEAGADGPDDARIGRKAAQRKTAGGLKPRPPKNASASHSHSESKSVPAPVPNQGEKE